MVEYAIVLSLIAVVVVVGVTFVGRSTKSPLCSVAGGLAGGLTTYSKAVLSDCPEAYWRMDEAGGTVAADSSGHDHQGTYHGAVTFAQPGAVASGDDTAVALNGIDAYLSATVPASTQMSVEVWAKSATDCWNNYGFISSARLVGGYPANGWIIHPNADPSCGTTVTVYVFGASDGNHGLCTFDLPPVNIWNQYTLTIAGSVAAFYLNGRLVCGPAPLSMVRTDVGTVPVTFGQDLGIRFLHGWIDEAAIYHTALTAAQVMAHYTAAGA